MRQGLQGNPRCFGGRIPHYDGLSLRAFKVSQKPSVIITRGSMQNLDKLTEAQLRELEETYRIMAASYTRKADTCKEARIIKKDRDSAHSPDQK